MKIKKQVLEAVKRGKKSRCIDERDFARLIDFFPCEEWAHFNFKLKEGIKSPEPKDFTRENVLEQLKGDVAFGFEKALDNRGISSGLMYEVVKMWMWVLDDSLEHFDEYAMYGLPLFKAVALKYGFDNPIGDDAGSEEKYDDH